MNNLELLIGRADMNCTVQDMIDGKIPDEYIKKRNFFYHFVFRHIESKAFVYPSRIDYYAKVKEGKYKFFEPAETIRESDNKVMLKKAEDFDFNQLNPKQLRGLNFNVAFELGDIIQPYFTTINTHIKPKVYDILDEVMVFFINKSDYETHRKFLDRTIIGT